MVGQQGWRRRAVVVLFLGPSLVPLLLSTVGPMVASVGLSLLRWNLLKPPKLIGLDNYARLLGDRDFQAAVLHTIEFVAGYMPLVLVGGLFIALALNQRLRGLVLFRTIYFMPGSSRSRPPWTMPPSRSTRSSSNPTGGTATSSRRPTRSSLIKGSL